MVNLPWSLMSPLATCFEDPKQYRFVTDWVPVEPPLPEARILSQSVLASDITPSPHDNVLHWSCEAELDTDGSAVRVCVQRWRGRKPNAL